ncbi:hypothetical protein Cch01nite_33990 [Cellulomonas chitinilytica]|uniref:Uncharacterized protein n=1 Tax=Cellulomonas chitinilytica TaxID=398759 RepID=A0A919P4R7_9CELL|nr:hypothetical protein [Cellulomonas chitinilytica]GIG22675.1 hypothetical protein Cch01nite_33990 [Cellulomonas chitinilytica]
MTVASAIKARTPVPVRRALRRVERRVRPVTTAVTAPVRRHVLRTVIRDLTAQRPRIPTARQARRLAWGWDNPRAAANVDYVRAVAWLAGRSDGPILECGSGLTTVVLAVYASQPVVSLESDPGWHRRIRTLLDDIGLAADGLHLAPVEQHDGFEWYRVPSGLPERFALVVCDGPPGLGREGGRVGLLPVMHDRLTPGCLVLVDAHMQQAETFALTTWQDEYGLEPARRFGTALALRVPG